MMKNRLDKTRGYFCRKQTQRNTWSWMHTAAAEIQILYFVRKIRMP